MSDKEYSNVNTARRAAVSKAWANERGLVMEGKEPEIGRKVNKQKSLLPVNVKDIPVTINVRSAKIQKRLEIKITSNFWMEKSISTLTMVTIKTILTDGMIQKQKK